MSDDADVIERSDLTIVGLHRCCFVDVSVVHASAPSYVARHAGPRKLNDMKRVIREKREKYQALAEAARADLIPLS